jgi:N-acetylglucosamine malate deacetylase 1
MKRILRSAGRKRNAVAHPPTLNSRATRLDILAIGAHRDDVEFTCGGTLLKMAELGHLTGILDLTQGEMGSRGSAKERARESEIAAGLLRCTFRRALDIPDARVENTWANRLKIARVICETRPRVVILPYWEGRHPDHYTASTLGYEACFLAGLGKVDVGADLPVHRPAKIVYCTMGFFANPTFVVDITPQFATRMRAVLAYRSQFTEHNAMRVNLSKELAIRQRAEANAHFYGMMAGVKFAESFVQREVGLIEDLTLIPVRSM